MLKIDVYLFVTDLVESWVGGLVECAECRGGVSFSVQGLVWVVETEEVPTLSIFHENARRPSIRKCVGGCFQKRE